MDNWVAHTRKATVPFNLNYSAKVILITDLTNSRVLHLLISNTTIMYANGNGVPENDAEAIKWYRKAADQGDADAQYNLGNWYANGRGVPENDVEAVKWYRKAADQGHAKAQSNLGVMYYGGDGVPENNIRAYVWWSMAKTQGHTFATENLEMLKPQMTKQQIAEGQALAAKCYESDYKDCD
jgi:TPR repeat protein